MISSIIIWSSPFSGIFLWIKYALRNTSNLHISTNWNKSWELHSEDLLYHSSGAEITTVSFKEYNNFLHQNDSTKFKMKVTGLFIFRFFVFYNIYTATCLSVRQHLPMCFLKREFTRKMKHPLSNLMIFYVSLVLFYCVPRWFFLDAFLSLIQCLDCLDWRRTFSLSFFRLQRTIFYSALTYLWWKLLSLLCK